MSRLFLKIFGKKIEDKGSTHQTLVADHVRVHNNWGFGSQGHLLIKRTPDLKSIFENPASSPPHEMDSQTQDYWNRAGAENQKTLIMMLYMTHPDPFIRIGAINIAKSIRTIGVEDVLDELVKSDIDKDVRVCAAKAIWDRSFFPSSRDMISNLGYSFSK